MMRYAKYLLAIMLLCLSKASIAQGNEPYIYGEIGVGDGTHGLVHLTQNMVFSYNNIISVSYYYASRRAPNMPSDYIPGSFDIPHYPQVSLSTIGISYGKMIFVHNPYIRYVIRGGICAGAVHMPANFEKISYLLEPNYTYSRKEDFVMGLVLDPLVELALGKNFGFSAGPYINLNPSSPVFAIEINMMFGKVSGSRKQQ